MKAKYMIITNNSLIKEQCSDINYINGDFKDVLIKVRDYIHLGYRPVTHPLPASIRMFLSPVRSIVIVKEFRQDSLEVIESSITKYEITLGERLPDYANLDDYEVIDAQLLEAAFEELEILSGQN